MRRSEVIKLGRESLVNLPRDLERGIKLSANDRYMITKILLEIFEEVVEESITWESEDAV